MYKQHLDNLVAAREALQSVDLFKGTYKAAFQAVENTLTKLAAAEGTMPVLNRLKKQLEAKS